MSPIKAAVESVVRVLAKSFSKDSEGCFNRIKAGPLETNASAGIRVYVDTSFIRRKDDRPQTRRHDRRNRGPFSETRPTASLRLGNNMSYELFGLIPSHRTRSTNDFFQSHAIANLPPYLPLTQR
jgi:hypothetical protein